MLIRSVNYLPVCPAALAETMKGYSHVVTKSKGVLCSAGSEEEVLKHSGGLSSILKPT